MITFDQYIDESINDSFSIQEKKLKLIPRRIEENIKYLSKDQSKYVIDQDCAKILYYFYASCETLLDFCYQLELQCKLFAPSDYQKAKNKAIDYISLESSISSIDNIFTIVKNIFDQRTIDIMSDSIERIDQWILLVKKIEDSKTTRKISAYYYKKYQIQIDLTSINTINVILKKSKTICNKLVSSRRIIAYILSNKNILTEEQEKSIRKLFNLYLKKEKDYLNSFFKNAKKFHN